MRRGAAKDLRARSPPTAPARRPLKVKSRTKFLDIFGSYGLAVRATRGRCTDCTRRYAKLKNSELDCMRFFYNDRPLPHMQTPDSVGFGGDEIVHCVSFDDMPIVNCVNCADIFMREETVFGSLVHKGVLDESRFSAVLDAYISRGFDYTMNKILRRRCSACGICCSMTDHHFHVCAGCPRADFDDPEIQEIRSKMRPRFCSVNCQREHWLSGHKDACPRRDVQATA